MRMLFLVVLLIIPGMARAVNSDCRQITGQNAQTTCENTAGCHWVNKCLPCREDYYCPGNNNAQILCSDVDNGNFDESDEGSESSAECYKQITCEKADGAPDNNCRHYNTSNNPYRCGSNLMTPAHMESTVCYYNHRNCELFSATGCDNGTKWGDAIWENNQWNLRGTVAGQDVSCRCKNENFTNETCQGINTIRVHTSTAATVSTEITYTGGDVMEYYCTGCNSGYYIETIYNYNDAPGNCKNSNNNVVCSCSIIPQGWYGTENCSWNADTLTSNPCPKNKCPAGQTTQTTGSTSAEQCKYTGDTQFCDAKGCFSLSSEWAFNP